MMRRAGFVSVLIAALVLVAPVGAGQTWPEDAFVDDDGNVHEIAINVIANLSITAGCNPPINDEFCPGDSVTRAQMAAFLRRSMNLPLSTTDHFTDDDNSVFEADINAIAEVGITAGCNPPTNDRYCPINNVTRAQMATFLVRAFDLVALPPDPALDFVLAFTGVCDDDQLLCEEDIVFPAATEWPIDEGWFYVLPYAPGDEDAFESSQTTFRVWVDGSLVPTQAQPTETIDGEAIRRYVGTLPRLTPGTHLVVGEWWWDGAPIYRTELNVLVP